MTINLDSKMIDEYLRKKGLSTNNNGKIGFYQTMKDDKKPKNKNNNKKGQNNIDLIPQGITANNDANNNNNILNDGNKNKLTQNKNQNQNNNLKDPNKVVDELYNQILSKKEIRLFSNSQSQYVAFVNKIGENSCFINVIIHFLYIFPCVNDYLIRKYQEKIEKEKEKEKGKEQNKNIKKEKNEKNENEGNANGNDEQNENNMNNMNNLNDKNINKNKKNEKNNKNEFTPNPNDTPKNPNNVITPNDSKKKSNKENLQKKNQNENKNNIDSFLFDLGKLLNSYQNILSSNDIKEQITELNTNQLRKSLSISSDNYFKLNSINDPVEFLNYILELINKENFQEIHLYFHLKLIEEKRCSNFCPYKYKKIYDKDNFMYQIYVEDIFNLIKNYNLDFDIYKEKLFMLSYYSLNNEVIKCEKCNSKMNKTLICNNKQGDPKFLLINCVWNNFKPELQDVVKFLFLISLIEEIDNLFICPNKFENDKYYLIGIIFYSFSLCHYINMIFNIQKNIFTLYNDEGIIEFKNINDLYKYITIEQFKKNNQAYFYPVLLVYGKENIYDEEVLPIIKHINKTNYEILIKECNDEIRKIKKKREEPLTEEQKLLNYRELVLAQMKHDKEEREKELNNLRNGTRDNYNFLNYTKRSNVDEEIKKLNLINDQSKKNQFLKSQKGKFNSQEKTNNIFNRGHNYHFNNDNERGNNLLRGSNYNFDYRYRTNNIHGQGIYYGY